MRFTRCDACGAKALMAASQCPKCSHWLGLRNDKGESVPLARCKSCQCYYPRRQDGCKWCGTPQPTSRPSSIVWGAVGVVMIAGAAWGAVRVLGDADAVAPPRMTTVAKSPAQPATPAPVPPSPSVSLAASPSVPPAASPSVSPAAPPVTPATAPVQSALVKAAPPPDTRTMPAPRRESPSAMPRSATVANVAEPKPTLPDANNPADTVRPMPGGEGTARTWVNVRAATGRAAEVLGVITPDTRVRFGQARGAWIQVRTAALSGWADRRLFSVVR